VRRSCACWRQAGAPGFLIAILFSERAMPLRQALQLLDDPDAAAIQMNAALAALSGASSQ
jgi:hypothetical protein